MQPNKKQIEEYLELKINPLFQSLMVDLIKLRPRNILHFSKSWFEKKIDTLAENPVDSDTESDDEEDVLSQQTIQEKKAKPRWYKQRKAICGQVYGTHNRLDDYEISSIEKNPLINNRILFRLKSLFLFKDFDDEDTSKLISAMTEETYEVNKIIIRQGDEGNQIYIVDEGQLHCYRRSQGQDIYIKTITEGEMFGQISMLYNTKRTANIRVKTRATCFKLDRKTFNTVVRQKNIRKRKMVMDIMKKIDIFKQLTTEEKYQIQDVIQQMPVHQNQYIIRQGKTNNKLFMVERGKLVALKKEKNGHQKITQNFNDGDFFSLNSLINKNHSPISVMALTTSKLYYLQAEAVQKVIGPIKQILYRNVDVYEKYKNI